MQWLECSSPANMAQVGFQRGTICQGPNLSGRCQLATELLFLVARWKCVVPEKCQ